MKAVLDRNEAQASTMTASEVMAANNRAMAELLPPSSAPVEPTLAAHINDLETEHAKLRDRAAAEARNLANESARLDLLEARRG